MSPIRNSIDGYTATGEPEGSPRTRTSPGAAFPRPTLSIMGPQGPCAATTFSPSQEEGKIAALRQTVSRLESGWLGAPPIHLSLGLPDIHHYLSGPGLPCGALHEVIAAAHGDIPASFGFALALMACALNARPGPALLVTSRQAADFGTPYGHGLHQLGLDVGRLLLVETRRGKDALWAMEEILRSDSAAVVAGAVENNLDLTMSRRLNLAASAAGTPLVLLRPPAATGTSAATTRWRIAAAPAGRGRFGAFAGWRWQVALERCRNGRAGQWKLEWDHVAHRFRLAEVLADRAPAESASPHGFRRAV